MSEEITIRLSEYESLETDQLTPIQAQLLAEKFGRYLIVQPTWGGGCLLRAQQYVGVIALDGLRILIRPKVPLDNLFYMLTYAYDLPQFRQEKADLAVAEDLFEFIVDIFVRQVDGLVRRGIHRAYVDREENDRFLRGRLLMGEHLHRNHILQDQFYQQRNEYTEDVLENQILRHTLGLLSRQRYRQQNLRHRVRRTQSAFGTVQPVAVTLHDCDHIHYNRLNERYRSRINLARLLLQHLSLEGQEGNHRFFAFIFDMNQIFELFVARYLKESFATHPALSIDIQPTIWLDTTQKEQGRPDLILRYNRQRVIVMDTKYKRFDNAPSLDDTQQMITYCHTMMLQRSLLIYADSHQPDYRREFRGIYLDALSLPLDGDLSLLRQRSQELVRQLIDLVVLPAIP
jgi:5-methylcytosine-specific restriction enzyme subunit McrC